jgi:hypothetical protein
MEALDGHRQRFVRPGQSSSFLLSKLTFFLSQRHPLYNPSRANRPNQHRSTIYLSPDNGGHGCCQPHLFDVFQWTASSLFRMDGSCSRLWSYITARVATDVRRHQRTSTNTNINTNIPTTSTVSTLHTRSSEQWPKIQSLCLSCLCVLATFSPTTLLPITTATSPSIVSSC